MILYNKDIATLYNFYLHFFGIVICTILMLVSVLFIGLVEEFIVMVCVSVTALGIFIVKFNVEDILF